MEGSARALGAPVTIEFDGETLILDPMTWKDYGTVEQHLLSRQPNPLDQAAESVQRFFDSLPDDASDEKRDQVHRLCRDIMDRAAEESRKINKISFSDLFAWLGTPEGLAYSVWIRLESRYPGKYSLERANEVIDAMRADDQRELLRKSDQASGTDSLGNSTGPMEPGPTTTNSQSSASDPDESDAPRLTRAG